jgi:putative ABC transport system permease protein
MRFSDVLRFAGQALSGHRLRTTLSVTGVAVGIAAVTTLTALGEGARRYVLQEFVSLGSDLLIALPGKIETTGGAPAAGHERDLTLEDCRSIQHVEHVARAAPTVVANDTVRFQGRGRPVLVVGTTADFAAVRRITVSAGSFLPPGDLFQGGNEIVLGTAVAQALFDQSSPLGQVVRLGQYRFRVVGIMAPRGQSLGYDIDELTFIPVATAMRIFNRTSVFRVLIEARGHQAIPEARREVAAALGQRHRADDFTLITQDAVLTAFSAIMRVLTAALAGIASVSLAVAGIGIMNVMLVSVTERRAEIGLLKAIGAADRQVMLAFLVEAGLLSALGGVLGLGVGLGAIRILVEVYPTFPATPPVWAMGAALLLSVVVGVVFGVLPARRATHLDPVTALARR